MRLRVNELPSRVGGRHLYRAAAETLHRIGGRPPAEGAGGPRGVQVAAAGAGRSATGDDYRTVPGGTRETPHGAGAAGAAEISGVQTVPDAAEQGDQRHQSAQPAARYSAHERPRQANHAFIEKVHHGDARRRDRGGRQGGGHRHGGSRRAIPRRLQHQRHSRRPGGCHRREHPGGRAVRHAAGAGGRSDPGDRQQHAHNPFQTHTQGGGRPSALHVLVQRDRGAAGRLNRRVENAVAGACGGADHLLQHQTRARVHRVEDGRGGGARVVSVALYGLECVEDDV